MRHFVIKTVYPSVVTAIPTTYFTKLVSQQLQWIIKEWKQRYLLALFFMECY